MLEINKFKEKVYIKNDKQINTDNNFEVLKDQDGEGSK